MGPNRAISWGQTSAEHTQLLFNALQKCLKKKKSKTYYSYSPEISGSLSPSLAYSSWCWALHLQGGRTAPVTSLHSPVSWFGPWLTGLHTGLTFTKPGAALWPPSHPQPDETSSPLKGSLKQGSGGTGRDNRPLIAALSQGCTTHLPKDFQKALCRQTYRGTVFRKETSSRSIPLCQKLIYMHGALNSLKRSLYRQIRKSVWCQAPHSQAEAQGRCACRAHVEATVTTAAEACSATNHS